MKDFGKYDVYAVSGSIYCYADSTTLRNRFGIRDAVKLRKIESDISVIRQSDLLQRPIKGHFSANHLCGIHRYLLGDVYAFAGHYRREDIAKGTTRFLSHKEIRPKLTALLKALMAERCLRDLEQGQLIERAAFYFAELNYIHPFREGNGRAIREFMRQLFDRNGYGVDWGAVSVDTLMDAMINSVYETEQLISVLHSCLVQNETVRD